MENIWILLGQSVEEMVEQSTRKDAKGERPQVIETGELIVKKHYFVVREINGRFLFAGTQTDWSAWRSPGILRFDTHKKADEFRVRYTYEPDTMVLSSEQLRGQREKIDGVRN